MGESSSAGERSWSRVGRRRGSVSPFSQARPARQRPAGRGKRPLIGCHRPGRREAVCLLYCIWSLRVKMGSVVMLLCAGIKRSAYRDRQQRFQTQSHDRHTGHNAPYLVPYMYALHDLKPGGSAARDAVRASRIRYAYPLQWPARPDLVSASCRCRKSPFDSPVPSTGRGRRGPRRCLSYCRINPGCFRAWALIIPRACQTQSCNRPPTWACTIPAIVHAFLCPTVAVTSTSLTPANWVLSKVLRTAGWLV